MSIKDKLKYVMRPVKYLDEQVLRHYTKLGQKINIDDGKRKYWIGLGLNTFNMQTSGPINRVLFGPAVDFASFLGLQYADAVYNWRGIFGFVKDDSEITDEKAIDSETYYQKRYNSFVRLPVFLGSVGLIGKSIADLVGSYSNGTPLDPTSSICLVEGISYLSLASSMYLKETDPKLLDKVPYWKKAYEWLKEKARELAPSPIPSPVPGYARTIEDLV